MDQLMNLFTNTETPFALLFVALFIFYVRDSKAREYKQIERYDLLQQDVKKQMQDVQTDLKTMLTIWKILIDNELERRKE